MTDETDLPAFNPGNWFWKVGGDDTRYWSSASGAYVQTAASGMITDVPDQAQLIAALQHLGLPTP